MRKFVTILAAAALAATVAGPAFAQEMAPVADPAATAANADLAPPPVDPGATPPAVLPPETAPAAPVTTASSDPAAAPAQTPTYHQQDVLAAAENAFGKGAEGLAKMIEKIFKEQGEPNAYIVGREGGAALLVGVRYGSGTLFHKIEGNLPVYWTGPSLGIDIGANGAKTFMLVYDLDDSEDLYKRFPGAEGAAYIIGGFTASHHRVGKTVVIPIHVGMGWRLGANVGYLKFSKTSKLLPF